jgi:divinyl protochlorophyllide a 8-vinyl-reductase
MSSGRFPSGAETARIGPNAVIQLGEALLARGERGLAREVYLAAGCPGWLDQPPGAMISELDVARLHRALARLVPADRCAEIAAEAGDRTGGYILANRIPKAARSVLSVLPVPIAARLLVKSIATHSWTFAGSGVFSYRPGRPLIVEIAGNPLAGEPRDAPGCVWHTAVFRRLFRVLVQPDAQVCETACCAAGDSACRFEISWTVRLERLCRWVSRRVAS